MSEKQQTLVALGLVFETSKAALAFLANPTQNADPSLDAPDLSLLHKDFLSLLKLVYGSTTKLSLVLKPSSPSYVAALEPLKELSSRVASLPHCVRLLQTDHGKTLAAEANTVAKDVLEALQSLIQTLITICSSSGGDAGGEYLVRTGAVHNVIDNARGRNGFSGNNLISVRKVLKNNQETLDDGLDEVRETMENAEESKDEVGDEAEQELDDGWAELGISSNVGPTTTELERIKKIYAIVRLSALLHQRILKDVLSTLSPALPLSKGTNVMLDNLADASSEFLSFTDNFISTMYPPQVADHINVELEGYQRQLLLLQSAIEPLMPEASIEERFQNIQLSATAKSTDHYAKLWKWYIACINQVDKNIHELKLELKGSENPLA